jgi:hypothetical protein
VVTETGIYQVQFSIIFQALHNYNCQISDTASNKLHTVTQSQLTAPAEWYKQSPQLVKTVIKMFCSPTDPRQLAHKFWGVWISKSNRYSYPCVQEQETRGLEKQLHTFFFSTLHVGQWSASCHSHFTNERSLKYSVNKKLGGSQIQSGCFGEDNYPLPLHNSLVIHHTDWTLNKSYYSVSRKVVAIKTC